MESLEITNQMTATQRSHSLSFCSQQKCMLNVAIIIILYNRNSLSRSIEFILMCWKCYRDSHSIMIEKKICLSFSFRLLLIVFYIWIISKIYIKLQKWEWIRDFHSQNIFFYIHKEMKKKINPNLKIILSKIKLLWRNFEKRF